MDSTAANAPLNTTHRLYNGAQALELALLVTLLGREAGNQSRNAMIAVACSVRNRVDAGLARFGIGWANVIEKKWQYSSIAGSASDPNLRKNPNLAFAPWPSCLEVAEAVYAGDWPDPTGGATNYYDRSLDTGNAPVWATDGEFVHTVDIDAFHFFKLAHL